MPPYVGVISHVTRLMYMSYLAKLKNLKIMNLASNCTYPNARKLNVKL